jgi:hypothetical protein
LKMTELWWLFRSMQYKKTSYSYNDKDAWTRHREDINSNYLLKCDWLDILEAKYNL